jgi:hypothetical protein
MKNILYRLLPLALLTILGIVFESHILQIESGFKTLISIITIVCLTTLSGIIIYQSFTSKND